MDITPSYSAVRHNNETVVVFSREVGSHEVARALYRLEGPGIAADKLWVGDMIFYSFTINTLESTDEVMNRISSEINRKPKTVNLSQLR